MKGVEGEEKGRRKVMLRQGGRRDEEWAGGDAGKGGGRDEGQRTGGRARRGMQVGISRP